MTAMPCILYYTFSVVLMLSFAKATVIDLSHKHGPTTLMSIAGSPGYNLTTLYKGESLLKTYVELNYYGSSEHGGTHLDAPVHFTKGGTTLDNIPLEHTILEGVMIDCKKEATSNPSYKVPVQKLVDWEKENGEIPREAAVLFSFGWYTKFDNETLYRGSTNASDSVTYIFPTVSLDAARWLLYNRSPRLLGSDTLSVDSLPSPGPETAFPIHVLYLGLNRLLIENLRDLDKLPSRGFRFHASPVKYVEASGAQVRAYALIYDSLENGVGSIQKSALLAAFLVSSTVILMQSFLTPY